MKVFNKTHVLIIEQRLKESGLSNQAILQDLLDHYCCEIEAAMEKGIDFEQAYKNAWNAINPNGVNEIEEELFFMLNFNKQTTMKKIVYLNGFFAATFIATALLFRFNHWPGTPALSVLGFAFLIITSLLVLIAHAKKFNFLTAQAIIRLLSGNTAAILIAIGSIFKIFYFPYANILTVTGFAILITLYIPTFFYHLYKQALTEA